jgi:MFS family permease
MLLAHCSRQAFSTKRMLIGSSALTALFSMLLAMGLNMHNQGLSGFAVVAFVISFSVGLAPMAWVVLPEVMPPEGRTAGSSIAVSVNWLINFAAVSLHDTHWSAGG